MHSSLRTLFSFILFSLFTHSSAQHGGQDGLSMTDSLEREIKKAKSDTAKLRLLLYTSNFYQAEDSLYAFKLCWDAMGIAQKLEDPYAEARVLNQIGKKYFDYSLSDKAISYYERAIEKITETDNKIFLAKIYTNMGNAYHMKSRDDKALDLYLRALKIYESEKDRRGEGKIYITLANVYSATGQYERQKEVLDKGLALTAETNDLSTRNACLINLGNYYVKVGKLQEALIYYRAGAKLSLELNNIQYYSNAIGNIGAAYGELGMSDSALFYMRENLACDRKIGNYYNMVSGYTNIAATLQDLSKYKEALQYADSAEKISRMLNYTLGLKMTYMVFAENNHLLGNDSAAYRYLQLYIAAKDSVMSADMNEKINSMSQLFEQEKKNAEIETLKEKNKNQNITTIFVAVAGFLVLLLALMLYKRNQLKSRANEQLGRQNTEIQMQKEIIEEKNRDITDSIRYAKRIQENFLPSEKYIEKNVRRMKR